MSLSACAVGPDFKIPATDLPSRFLSEATDGGRLVTAAAGSPSVDLSQWWLSLHDPQLDSLVQRAIAANPDALVALTRLQEARAQEMAVIGAALPNGEASAGAAYGTGSDNTRGRVSQILHSGGNTAGYDHVNEAGGFDAAWELDVFGKLRREIEAASFDAAAAAKVREAVLVDVIANVARAYIDLRSFQAQVAVARRNIQVAERSLQLAQTRFNQGLTNQLDVTLANRQLLTFEAGVAPLTSQIASSSYVIAELIGEYPEKVVGELAVPKPIPVFPAKIPVGIPVEVLQRRPDIQAIEFELGAANARLGSAEADLFPRVAAVGALGGQGGAAIPGSKSITFIGSVGPSLYWPILDFGTLDAQIEVADFRTKEVLQRYRGSVLQAVRQVDDAISVYEGQQARLTDLGRAKTAAVQAVTLSSERYDRGLTDFLNVLDAERQQFDIEAQYVIAQQTAGDQVVALYKALGGGWQHAPAVPPIRAPQPAIAAAARIAGSPDGPRPATNDIPLGPP